MHRISIAFRSFFSLLFTGRLPAGVASALGLVPRISATLGRKPEAARESRASDGALQVLSIFQAEARWIDFLMEDISGYTDAQVGAAVRNLHEQCRQALQRHFKLVPVVDGVEGTFTRLGSVPPGAVKLIGKVPASGEAAGGILRHRGWKSERADLPRLGPKDDVTIVAPAEVEIE